MIGGLIWLLAGGRRRPARSTPACASSGERVRGRKKLVLAVIDAMKPAMLRACDRAGRAPALALLMERGHHGRMRRRVPVGDARLRRVDRHGGGPDRHLIPSMNWYHRVEERYVEYGTSFKASQAFGFKRSLTDTIYRMNGEHLSADTPTVFETLDDADVRTAGTTYLMYRGRTGTR